MIERFLISSLLKSSLNAEFIKRLRSGCMTFGVSGKFRFWRPFTTNAIQAISRLQRFFFHHTLTPAQGLNGERLFERRVTVLGIPLSVQRSQRSYYRVALLVDEFFGGWDTPIGGYGALAKNCFCRLIPGDEIKVTSR